MRNVRLLLVALVLVALPVLVSASGTLETVGVDSWVANPISSEATLDSGTTYLLEASGMYEFGTGGRYADAEYYLDTQAVMDGWEKDRSDWGDYGVLDLLVDPDQDGAIDPDWGEYNSDHTYTMCYEGQGRAVSFVISDWYHEGNNSMQDNSGSLAVDIYKLGCVTEFLPPITNADFELQDGSTLPIKFRMCEGSSSDIQVTITGPDFGETFTPTYDAETGEYIVVFQTKDYDLDVGNYAVSVSSDGCELGTFPFYLDVKANRGNSGK